jgi:hypothetical protein
VSLPKPGDELYHGLRVGSVIRESAYVTSYDGVLLAEKRPVAVSFLRVPADQRRATQRFIHDALGNELLHDPSIARILAVGTHEGVPWLAIEEVAGKDLDLVVAESIEAGRPIDVERAVDITLGILRALQVAHRAGIAHWDLSPWGVAVVGVGAGGEATKVLDLGVAHAVHARLEPGAAFDAMRHDVRAAAAILLELVSLPGSRVEREQPALFELAQASAYIPARYGSATELACALMDLMGPRSSEVRRRLRGAMGDGYPTLQSIEITPASRRPTR